MNKVWQQIQQKVLMFSRIPKKQQYLFYLSFFFILVSYIGYSYHQNIYQYQQQQYIHQKLLAQLTHQNKIIKSLQKKAQQLLLTPAVAKQLLPVNKSIKQQLLPSLYLKYSQWEMAQHPLLKLTVVGDFISIRYFLFQILQKNSRLKLVKCSFSKLINEEQDPTLLVNDNEQNENGELVQDNQKISSRTSGKIESEILFQLQLL